MLGASFVLGSIAVFDALVLLRCGGAAEAAGRIAVPLAAAGLAVQAATGVFLLAADARSTGTNAAFVAKLAFIAVGLANVGLLHVWLGRGSWTTRLAAGQARLAAAVSLAAWSLTVIAGRLIAYV